MSEERESSRRSSEENDAASLDEKNEDGRSQRKRGPMKVVDRRFWAREEGDEAEEAPDPGQSPYPKVVEELQAQLEDSRGRLRELTAAYRQVQREGEEVHRRLNRELDRKVTLAKADLFRELLDVVDNLERALGAAGGTPQTSDLAQGVEQVLAQMRRLLQAQGVEEIEVAGRKFDPEVAEAIEVRQIERAESDDTVIEVAQRGYRYSGRTLRPARVVVGKVASSEQVRPEASQAGEASPGD